MNAKQTRTALIVTAVAVVLILTAGIVQWVQRSHAGTLELSIAPTGAQVSIDGSSTSKRLIDLAEGNHTIKVQRQGFAPKSADLTIRAGQMTHLSIALVSNSADTHDWYTKHPDDWLVVQGESSSQFDQKQASSLTRYPVLNYIPHTAHTNGMAAKWTIDPQWAGDDDLRGLSITAVSCDDAIAKAYFTEARQYLLSNSINITQYQVVYMVNCGQITKYQGEV